jgi:hypothetical protein
MHLTVLNIPSLLLVLLATPCILAAAVPGLSLSLSEHAAAPIADVWHNTHDEKWWEHALASFASAYPEAATATAEAQASSASASKPKRDIVVATAYVTSTTVVPAPTNLQIAAEKGNPTAIPGVGLYGLCDRCNAGYCRTICNALDDGHGPFNHLAALEGRARSTEVGVNNIEISAHHLPECDADDADCAIKAMESIGVNVVASKVAEIWNADVAGTPKPQVVAEVVASRLSEVVNAATTMPEEAKANGAIKGEDEILD